MPVLAEQASKSGASVRTEVGRNTAVTTTREAVVDRITAYKATHDARLGATIHDRDLHIANALAHGGFQGKYCPKEENEKVHE